MKTVVTITGIRPDFIRMSSIFKKLDENFNHILIHTGQHYDQLLSYVFFRDLEIRNPDYLLNTGKESSNHYEQLSYLSTHIIDLFKSKNINPDLVIFLGDSNSVCAALPLKKEGYRICHIEAGMRSYDKRMLEEINRTVCDHCSDLLFVYHEDYADQLRKENITENVHVVGNTIVEVCMDYILSSIVKSKVSDLILMDIHRPENFNYKDRLEWIFSFANLCIDRFNTPVALLYFKRLEDKIKEFNLDLGNIQLINLMPYTEYLGKVLQSKFLISDSGTGQEEPALLGVPVLVPREYTERPQSYNNNCSYKLTENNFIDCFKWIDKIKNGEIVMNTDWLGDGKTSDKIIDAIKSYLY